MWIYILSLGAIIGAVVVFAWNTIKTSKARSTIAIKKAAIEIDLFKKRSSINKIEKDKLASLEQVSKQKRIELDKQEIRIKNAAKKSRDALVLLINESFRK